MGEEVKSEMNASEIAIRKFLKQLGVTGHQKLSEALQMAVQSGQLAAGCDVAVTAKIEIIELEFDTAWSPPEEICYALREMFQDVNISWFFDEPGMEVAGYL